MCLLSSAWWSMKIGKEVWKRSLEKKCFKHCGWVHSSLNEKTFRVFDDIILTQLFSGGLEYGALLIWQPPWNMPELISKWLELMLKWLELRWRLLIMLCWGTIGQSHWGKHFSATATSILHHHILHLNQQLLRHQYALVFSLDIGCTGLTWNGHHAMNNICEWKRSIFPQRHHKCTTIDHAKRQLLL